MNSYKINKYIGFSVLENEVENMADKGWFVCGFTWEIALTKDVFVVTFKEGTPKRIRVTSEKYFGFDNAERAMTNMKREGWDVVGNSWSIAVLKDIFVTLYTKDE